MIFGIGSRKTQEPELFTKAQATGVASRKEIASITPAGNGISVCSYTLPETRFDLRVESPVPVGSETLEAVAMERFKRGAPEDDGWLNHRIESIKPS